MSRSVQIRLPEELSRYCEGRSELDIEGNTLGGLLANLVERFPTVRSRLLDSGGQLRSHLVVILNGSALPRQKLTEASVSPRDELEIKFLAVGG